MDEKPTRVDLGDDLLENTRSSMSVSAPATSSAEESVSELLESAAILESQGLRDDAKRLLRRVLRQDSRNVPARKKLEAILKLELDALLAGSPLQTPTPVPGEVSRLEFPVDDPAGVDSEAVMRALDRDFQLGVFRDGTQGESIEFEVSVFGDRENREKFEKDLEGKLAGASARDCLDLAIAFLEMDLFSVALHLLERAEHDSEIRYLAAPLRADALIRVGRAFEAVLILEPLWLDPEVSRAGKLEYMYLMARAKEQLGRFDQALEWYRRVESVDADYRETAFRVRSLLRRIGE